MVNVKQLSARMMGSLRDLALRTPLKNLPGAKRGYDFVRSATTPSEPVLIEFEGYELYIDPSDRIGYQIYRGKWEPEVMRAIRQNVPGGGTAVDVGGHFGVYTLLMRKCVGDQGNVVVFEPHPENARMIRRTIDHNGFDNVELVEAAVAATAGTTTFRAVEETSLSSTYNDISLGDSFDETKFEVETIVLDDYFSGQFEAVDFVKIDIQGAEIDAIRGLQDSIENIGSILLELHKTLSDDELVEIFDFLYRNGEIVGVDSGTPITTVSEFRDSLHVLWTNA